MISDLKGNLLPIWFEEVSFLERNRNLVDLIFHAEFFWMNAEILFYVISLAYSFLGIIIFLVVILHGYLKCVSFLKIIL